MQEGSVPTLFIPVTDLVAPAVFKDIVGAATVPSGV